MSVNSVDVREFVERVTNSSTFKDWDKADNYLASCFYFNEWSVGFYSKKTGKMTTFSVNDEVEIKEDGDVFQEKKEALEELDIDNVRILLDDALLKVDKIKEERVLSEDVTQKIIILQQKTVPVWNVTYTTSGFNILTVKVDASSGEILDSSLSSIMNLRKES